MVVMMVLEFFWPEKGVDQICRQQSGKYRSDPVFQQHFTLLKTITGLDIGPTDGEKTDRRNDQNNVCHWNLRS